MATTYTIQRGTARWSVPNRYDLYDAFIAMRLDGTEFPFGYRIFEHETDTDSSQELHTAFYPDDDRAEARWIIQHPDTTPVVTIPRASILASQDEHADDPDEGIQ